MDIFAEMLTALASDLTISSTSTLFDTDTKKLAMNRAYRRCGGLYRWPETEDAQQTKTTGNEYFDYPSNWRPNSIYRLVINGVPWGDEPDNSPVVFSDYEYHKYKYPNRTDKIWSNHGRRYFHYPIQDASGTNNLKVWGHKVVDELVNDTDVTIFSYAYPECNDAVVLEAGEILKTKGEQPQEGQLLSARAKEILTAAYNRIRQERSKYEKVNPFFEVPDYFQGMNGSLTQNYLDNL